MNNYSSSFKYGREHVAFEVVYTKRKTMEIAVHPDAIVIVKVPIGISADKIAARLAKRARWIRKQLSYFQQFIPRTLPRQYAGGETHLYLGRQYRLKIRKGKKGDVKLKGAYFQISTPDQKNRQDVKKLLDNWCKEHARKIFAQRLGICFEKATSLKVPFPSIQLRKMSKRWGSCSNTGYILLNTELIKAPLYCIDYVIMHELCHLKDHSHSHKYYRLLSKYMPDWEKRKERLERAVV
ncbi:MAG: M48 family metallopeptidase [Nitrospirae bacterium]|nr:M48 family metallopeptidase [Nitrospirota bacterium]